MNVGVDEAAQLLGCSRRRVFQLLADGTLDRAPRYGRALRIDRESVERALQEPAPKPGRKRRTPSAEIARPEDVPVPR